MGFLDSKIKTLENGKQVLELPNSVNFLILTGDYHVIMGNQWRACCNSNTTNLFGGYLDGNETYMEALKRELKEETNLELDDFMLETVYLNKRVSAGTTTERNSLFILISKDNVSKVLKKMKCNDIEEGISFKAMKLDNDLFEEMQTDTVEGLRSFIALTTCFLLMVNEAV